MKLLGIRQIPLTRATVTILTACMLLVGGSRLCKAVDAVHALVSTGDMTGLVNRFYRDRDSLSRFYGIRVSEKRASRLDTFYESWSTRLERVDFASLSQSDKVDYVLLDHEIEVYGLRQDRDREGFAMVSELLPFTDAIISLEEDRWALETVDPREAAGQLAELAGIVDALSGRVKRVPETGREDETESFAESDEKHDEQRDDANAPLFVTPVLAKRAERIVREMKTALENWYENHATYQPEFGWWVGEPYERLDEALEGYRKHLRETVAGQKGEDDDPLIGDPLGRDALEEAISAEFLAESPEELLAIGTREFAWCEERMKDAAFRLGYENWRDALEYVKELHVSPGEQDQLVAEQARSVIDWLDERDLVTIEPLCRETWRVEMLSKDDQQTLPFAAYGGQRMLVAYPTQNMDHETKEMSLRGNNIHFTRIVTPHELIPGHHLQGYMSQRYAPHRQRFRTPFLVEGWALYWEMFLWDEGYPQSPEDEIGMLFWRMHRCARILVTIRFHLGEMSTEEMIEFLVERVGHEQHTATSEVRRYVGGSYGPLYQCAYMIGGLQLRDLARELVDSGKMTRKEFHDAVLRQNSIPVALIRAQLSDEKMTRNWTSSWRFYE